MEQRETGKRNSFRHIRAEGELMNETLDDAFPGPSTAEGPDDSFLRPRQLANHWVRPDVRAYYWYLTFENSPDLQSFVRKCQEVISFPYYDLIPPGSLHLTLDRIAFEGEITSDQLRAIEAAAIGACVDIAPFGIAVGNLGGTSSAIGFSASPKELIRRVRDALREATISSYPSAPVKDSEFHPHITIAYCNSDNVPVNRVVAAMEKLSSLPSVQVDIQESALVLLERRQQTYSWQAISRIPLSG
ncbi:2'-5' RNA ligase family protein [Streptosporangium sp. NBC_01495]|uniref:2'-5' RNA ligase family protein n=1 Tax=Streptosporangium sp. NBC_01495 TaxID=2903899 RepID=UPI002E357C24|nr:2'-5' RNA ligase family protein [Streptosporangium sp. NBC_01495]